MKRQIPKIEVDKAKKELRDVFISRIIKNVNGNGCWYLKALQKPGVVGFYSSFQ